MSLYDQLVAKYSPSTTPVTASSIPTRPMWNDQGEAAAERLSQYPGQLDPDPSKVGDWRTPSDGQGYIYTALRTAAQNGDAWALNMLRQMNDKWALSQPAPTPTDAIPKPIPRPGGGGGTGGGGGNGGTGGGGMPNAAQQGAPEDPGQMQDWLAAQGFGDLTAQTAADAANDLSLDPVWRNRMLEIANQMQGMQGKLIDLNPELAAELDKVMAAERGQADLAYGDAKDDLLLRAFGSGTQQSTIFGDAAGRLAYGQAQIGQQILSADAQRRLGLRTQMTEQAMANLNSQADVLGQGAQIDIAGLNVEGQNRDRRLQLLTSQQGMWNQQADRYEQGREFGLDLGFRYKQLATQAALERASIAVQRMNAQTNAQELALRDQWHTSDQNFARMQWLEGVRQWGMEYEQDERQIQYGLQQNSDARADANRQANMAMWGTIIGLAFSDERLKDNIEDFVAPSNTLSAIRGVSWNWKDTGLWDAGVIAQDVDEVMPQAVVEIDDVLHVNYRALVGLLVSTVNELNGRLKKLEGK